MASTIETAFAVILQRVGVPYVIDVHVKTEFTYYTNQLDIVVLPGSTINHHKTVLPIDIELDDPSHEELKRSGKDDARDVCFQKSQFWYIKNPPVNSILNNPCKTDSDGNYIEVRPSWVIMRIPYSIIEKIIRTGNTKKYPRFSFKEEHKDKLEKMEEFLLEASRKTEPELMEWE